MFLRLTAPTSRAGERLDSLHMKMGLNFWLYWSGLGIAAASGKPLEYLSMQCFSFTVDFAFCQTVKPVMLS